MSAQPFNGPAALLADEQEQLRDVPLVELQAAAAEPDFFPFGPSEKWQTVRKQAALRELERRGRKEQR